MYVFAFGYLDKPYVVSHVMSSGYSSGWFGYHRNRAVHTEMVECFQSVPTYQDSQCNPSLGSRRALRSAPHCGLGKADLSEG